MVQSPKEKQSWKQRTAKIMNPQVKLRELIEAIDLQSNEMASYFNRITGRIITISEEEVRECRCNNRWGLYNQTQVAFGELC
jgi:hypothetical protein